MAIIFCLVLWAFVHFYGPASQTTSVGDESVWTILLGLLLLVVLLLVYFYPSVNALSKQHKNAGAIFVLNLLLGWTLLGWVAALVWSFTK